MLKRNDLKPNLASFQKFLRLHCWHSPRKAGAGGEGAAGRGRGTVPQGAGSQEGSRID